MSAYGPCLQHALYRASKVDLGRRFHALMDKVFRRDALQHAWVAVHTNNGAPGIDKDHADQSRGVRRRPAPIELTDDLKAQRYRSLAARRALIPQPGSGTGQRPLSIPSVRDRIVQAALKIVLEPVFEADMADCSFGFPPRRSPHDAL